MQAGPADFYLVVYVVDDLIVLVTIIVKTRRKSPANAAFDIRSGEGDSNTWAGSLERRE